LRVELRRQPADRDLEVLGAELRRGGDRCLLQVGGDRGCGLRDVVRLLEPRVGQRRQHLPERRLPMARLVREVRAREERPTLVVQHAGHRPAAVTRHRLRRRHVDRVDIGPLLAVDLDVDEELVHHAAVASSSKLSCAITWHQWQAA
jgi:hypothetical protein